MAGGGGSEQIKSIGNEIMSNDNIYGVSLNADEEMNTQDWCIIKIEKCCCCIAVGSAQVGDEEDIIL